MSCGGRASMGLATIGLPLLLVLFGPLDLLIGLWHGNYPTEATLISLTSLVIGIVLFRFNTGQSIADATPDRAEPQDETVAATAQLNLRLGTGLLVFGMALNLLFIINGLVGAKRGPDSPAGNLVETGFIVLFNLLVAGLEAFAARIYTASR